MKQDVEQVKFVGVEWIIVNIYKGLYIMFNYVIDSDIIGDNGVRNKIVLFMNEFGIDFVF